MMAEDWIDIPVPLCSDVERGDAAGELTTKYCENNL